VILKSNDTDLIQDTMLLTDYINGWDTKDIIALLTHGKANPDAEWGPDPYVVLGIGGFTYGGIAAKIQADVPDPAMRPGLYPSGLISLGPDSLPFLGRDIMATRAFWEHHHGGKLDKKLIYVLACQSAAHPGLAEALTGTDSIFLGWSEPVTADRLHDVSELLFKEMAEDAFPVLRSFVRECGTGACVESDSEYPPADLLAGWNRADLRTVDSLSLAGPPQTGFCGISPTIPVDQTCTSCGGGFPMGISYGITLAGLEPETLVPIVDPLEFGLYQLRLFADVDDVESGYAWPLTDQAMTGVGNGQYTLPFVSLFMDDICPYQSLEYNPWVLLPAFDVNQGGNGQRDRIYSWDGPFMVTIDPTVLP